ncbi:hypothetical protein PAHAL_2G343300 [Panicum hallii]|uniref:Uncharacterized protein n=1 Tax=Panicum hallii TaxID=206008 RepID=A0A2S3H1Q5_9POAL|nr:protein SHORT INTERNODES-like [Panicum hallii]PAN13514.1 hypothetical protein PAHAL_2G343300 [Panicum hallii]
MHHASDAASFLSAATSADGSLEQQRQLVRGAASSSPRGTGAAGIIRYQDCWLLAKAGCAHPRCRHCCGGRGFACPAHVRPSCSDTPAFPCSEHHQRTLTSTAAVAPLRNPHKRPRPRPPPRAPAATPTTSSVDQPTTAAPGSFAREEVSLDAVFRRVRLGPDGAEVAYHATVTICGRVFRGVLYDVGSRRRRRSSTASTDTAGSSDGSSRSTAGGGLDLTLRL